MAIDVARHIENLLYRYDSVVIPGLGGIIAAYRPAGIDHVQGLIHPPSKKLSFNENLVINDGVLLDELREVYQISLMEAQDALTDFVEETRQRLDQREIVVFPNVGRLYKNYENQLRFLQDTTNFSTSVYGLPSLQYYPILRVREPSFDNAAAPRPAKQNTQLGRRFAQLARQAMPFLIGLVIVSAAIGIYRQQSQRASVDPTQTLPVVMEDRIVNQKPSQSQQSELSIGGGIINGSPATEETPLLDTESPTVAPDARECVIIVGAFSKKAGVEQRVRDIVDLGFSVYQDKKGRLTRVGIQFAYQDDKEISEKLHLLRDAFDSNAWVLQD